jgi:putative transposase
MINPTVNNLSVGDRIRWETGTIYAIDRMPTGKQTQIRLIQIDGSQVVNRSPALLERMFEIGQVALMNKPLNEQTIELRIADASAQERFYFQYRKAIARDLVTFIGGTAKSIQIEAILEITKQYSAKAHKRGLTPPQAPKYEAAKKWQRELVNRSNNTKLLVIDHRGNSRKPRLDERKREIMEETIRDIHNSRACSSVASEYVELTLRFQEEWPNLTPSQVVLKMPSRMTYYRTVQAYDGYQESKSRCNSEQHRKSISNGGATEFPEIIGGVMQVDSTRINVHIKVDGVKMGYRPWLTVLIDVYTRVITGWYISLSPPSSLAVSKVILMSATEHVSARRTIGITIYHDNGSEHCNGVISQLSSDIGFDLQPGAPHYPNHQAFIESNFSSMESRLFHLMGGTTFGKLGQDRPYASEKHPVYDLATLRSRVEEYIEIYHNLPHSGIHNMTPYQRWDLALEDRLHLPETITPEFATSLGLISLDRCINDGKVNAFGIQWKSPNSSTLDKTLRRQNRQAKIFIDPTNLGMIYLAHPLKPHKKIPGYAVNPAYQNDLCLDDHQRICEMFEDFNESYQDKAKSRMMLGIFYRKLREDAAQIMEKIDGKTAKRRRDFTESDLYRINMLAEAIPEESAPQEDSSSQSEPISHPFKTR